MARWNSEVNRILLMNDVKDRLANDGMVSVGGASDRVAELLKRDIAKWQRVVKTAGIKAEG